MSELKEGVPDEIVEFNDFINRLKKTAIRKQALYDGISSKQTIDEALRYIMEESGEVSSALTRDRFELALSECLDLAHAVFLVWLAIKRQLNQ